MTKITIGNFSKFSMKVFTLFLFASGLVSYLRNAGYLIIMGTFIVAALTWTIHDSIPNSEGSP